jgi:hypothetical protein
VTEGAVLSVELTETTNPSSGVLWAQNESWVAGRNVERSATVLLTINVDAQRQMKLSVEIFRANAPLKVLRQLSGPYAQLFSTECNLPY